MIWIIAMVGFLCLLSFVAGVVVAMVFWEEIADGLVDIMRFFGMGE